MLGVLINLATIFNILFYSPYLNQNISIYVLSIHSSSFIYQIAFLIQLESKFDIGYLEIMYIVMLPLYFRISKLYVLKK